MGLVYEWPDNIFVLQRDGEDHVKLLDFGLAKLNWSKPRSDSARAAGGAGTREPPPARWYLLHPLIGVSHVEAQQRARLNAIGATKLLHRLAEPPRLERATPPLEIQPRLGIDAPRVARRSFLEARAHRARRVAPLWRSAPALLRR